MRTKNSILNVITGIATQLLLALVGFVSRRVFVMQLGIDMQGINATLTSIITMLSVTELGIGTAIMCNLYKPLEEKNVPKIVALMQLYSKVYKVIAGIVLGLGIIVAPFVPKIVNEPDLVSNSYIISVFMLFLADVIVSYLFVYKRSIIIADQKNYIVTLAHLFSAVLMNIAQVVVLILTKNFVLFLVFKIFFRLVENIILAYIANKKYPYIVTKEKYKVEKDITSNIVGNTKALALHYIGNYLITGTDSLIIQRFLGSFVAGVYSNYYMIVLAIQEALRQFSIGIMASFGNLIACDEKDRLYNSFNQSFFIGFGLANFASISMLCLFNDFIEKIWIGDNSTLALPVVCIICFNSYMVIISDPLSNLRASAGLFRPDRYLHLFLAALNLIVSIVLVRIIGIFGVFLGTLLCLCIKEGTVLPIIIYKNLFNKSVWNYHKKLLVYIAFSVVCAALTYGLCSFVTISNAFLLIIVKAIICVIVPNLLLLLVFCRTSEFKSLKEIALRIIKTKVLKNKE